jgi:polysaccharide deacetylase 2 family uncharacterized protein YibQ
LQIACRHAWEGAAALLLLAALVIGLDSLAAGAMEFAGSLAPGQAALASDESAEAGPGVARLPMVGFAGASRYAPQVLFPVTGHSFPLWLRPSIAPTAPRHPVIAICIDDLGEDLAATDKAMALPRAVALSFLPYAEATPVLAQEAGAKGHAVLAHVPMEALFHSDPGAMALTVDAPDIPAKLAWNISRVPGLVGINNHEGSRFTQDAPSLLQVDRVLAERHLFFFDSRTIGDSRVETAARSAGVMSAGRDVFLDDEISEAAVRQQLDALAVIARRDGVAIAIGHPHDVTLKVLAAWLAENHGVELVSLPRAMGLKSQGVALARR